MTENSKRNYSIELLRIFLGCSVVVLHFNYLPGGTGAVGSTSGFTKDFLILLEILCICAVNTFVLISGYYGSKTNKIDFSKIVKLFVQTIVFQFVITLIECALSRNISIISLCKSLIPLNYYVVLYSSLMIISPFINKLLHSIRKETLKTLVLISFLLFSFYPTIVDILEEVTGMALGSLSSIGISGSEGGYTIVNFIVLYIIGAYLRISNLRDKLGSKKLIVVYILIIIMLCVWQRILPRTAYHYSNPLVILEAVCLFLIFIKINIKSRIINLLSSASFTCFLINISLLKFFGFDWLFDKTFPTIIIGMIVEVFVIYLLAFFATLLWNLLMKRFFAFTINKIPTYYMED